MNWIYIYWTDVRASADRGAGGLLVVSSVWVFLCFYLEKFIKIVQGSLFSDLSYFRFEKHVAFGLSWVDTGRACCKRLLFFLALEGSFSMFLCRFEVDYILCKDFWYSFNCHYSVVKADPSENSCVLLWTFPKSWGNSPPSDQHCNDFARWTRYCQKKQNIPLAERLFPQKCVVKKNTKAFCSLGLKSCRFVMEQFNVGFFFKCCRMAFV